MKFLNIKNFYIIIIILLNLLSNSFVECLICPNYCTCKWFLNDLNVDCSNIKLEEIPSILLQLPIIKLDLSNNNIKKFPSELSNIKTLNILDLTNNKIDYIEKNALNNFNTLKQLILNSNNITKWNNINPNHILLPAKNLELLSLDGNKFIEIPNINDMYNNENDNNNNDFNIDEIQNYYLYMNNENITLNSKTLITLNLNNCGIKYIYGKQFLKGLKKLKTLYLNNNQLTVIPKLISNNLQNLYMSNCKLNKINMNSLVHLKRLQTLDLSKNSDLKFLNNNNYYIKNTNTNNNETENDNDNDNDNDKNIIITTTKNYDGDDDDDNDNNQIKLFSLKYLNLTLCNLNKIDFLQYFPNLIQINLSDNMLYDINNTIFNNYCKNLEIINLSYNSIKLLHINTFINLTKLSNINLSFNAISRIDDNLFLTNTKLLNINLSRNFIYELNDINSKSLLYLDLNSCEILNISKTAFNYLPNIRDIDLSYNFIKQLPDGLESDTLEKLNLSYCRLSSINNETFSHLPELTILDLSGNHFTTTFKSEYFLNNGFLQFIWLGNNPWHCDCKEPSFFKFYSYLMKNPAKLIDRQQTTCETPTYHNKKAWSQACYGLWFPDQLSDSSTTTTVFMILFIVGTLACVTNVSRNCHMSREREEFRQHERNIEEQISIARYNQMVIEQAALLNAPDPRETNPPSYEDALRMPQLVRPFQSMNELAAKRSGRSLRRSTTTNEMNDNNENDNVENSDDIVLDPITFHSEEIISERNTERTLNINNDKKFQNRDHTARRFHANDRQFSSSYYKAQNLESAERMTSFHSLENSPYSIRKPKPYNENNDQSNVNENINENPTEIKEFKRMKSSDIMENYSSSRENSPYTKRKPKSLKTNENLSSENSLPIATSSSVSNNKTDDNEIVSLKCCQSSNESNTNDTMV